MFFAAKKVFFSKISVLYSAEIIAKIFSLDKIPDPKIFTASLSLSKHYTNQYIKEFIQNTPYFSILFDEVSNLSYGIYVLNIILYTGSISILIDTHIQDKAYNSDMYMNLILSTIHKHQINANKISAFVTDGASVMKATIKKLNIFLVDDKKLLNKYIKHIWCISNLINLLVSYLFEGEIQINKFVVLIKTYFHFGIRLKITKEIKENFGLKSDLLNFCETRWNGKLNCLSYMYENWNILHDYFIQKFELVGDSERILGHFDNIRFKEKIKVFLDDYYCLGILCD